MKKKANAITLLNTSNDTIDEFEISHAERILSFPNGGWILPLNSKYQYIKGDGIKLRANKGTSKSSNKEE